MARNGLSLRNPAIGVISTAMRTLLLAPLMGLAACATTSAGLADTNLEETFASTKDPDEVATCAANRMRGDEQVVRDGDRYWFVRRNTYGAATTRWDFIPDGNGGTRIELRASVPMNSGAGDVRACL